MPDRTSTRRPDAATPVTPGTSTRPPSVPVPARPLAEAAQRLVERVEGELSPPLVAEALRAVLAEQGRSPHDPVPGSAVSLAGERLDRLVAARPTRQLRSA